MAESKNALRRSMRVLRDQINEELLEQSSQKITEEVLGLPQILTAKVIFVYISFRSEVQTHALIDQLLERDKQVCVPFIDESDRMQAVRFDGWHNMELNPFGFLVPREAVSENRTIELSIVPGLGFTREGLRLGYGKGHYDRFFSARAGGTKVGLAFDCQIVDQIPSEPFDCPMDYVLTESQMHSNGTQIS